LIKASVSSGSTKIKATEAFGQFGVFEAWKKTIAKELAESRKIGTSMGNYFYLQHNSKPSAKDIRSGISQKVQGTGALIFKLALLEINKQQQFRVVLPMHDAVLVEHDLELSSNVIVTIFKNTMTEFFDNKINGKASISDFFVSSP
jgi:DNA polymerase-1